MTCQSQHQNELGVVSNDIAVSLRHLESWCDENFVRLNPTKCSVMQVAFAKTELPKSDIILCDKVLKEKRMVKLLGILIESNLKWDAQVNSMVTRANRRLYMLMRSLKPFGMPVDDLITVFIGYIRPIFSGVARIFSVGGHWGGLGILWGGTRKIYIFYLIA